MSKDLQIELISRGLLMHAGHVLVCRSVKHNYVYLPGGHVEFGESAHAALEREFKEETALAVTPGRCLHVHEHIFRQGARLRHEVNVVFHVEHPAFRAAAATPPPPVHSEEKKIAFDWLTPADLRELDFRPRECGEWLLRFLEHPESPPVFWLGSTGSQ